MAGGRRRANHHVTVETPWGGVDVKKGDPVAVTFRSFLGGFEDKEVQ